MIEQDSGRIACIRGTEKMSFAFCGALETGIFAEHVKEKRLLWQQKDTKRHGTNDSTRYINTNWLNYTAANIKKLVLIIIILNTNWL